MSPVPPKPPSLPPSTPSSGDPAGSEGEARLDRLLQTDMLLPLPLGLVAAVLARIAAEPLPSESGPPESESDGGPFANSRTDFQTERRIRPGRLVAMAAAALLAIGAGIGGLWTATTSDGLDMLGRTTGASAEGSTVSSIVDLAAAARASTSASVRSLAAVPDQVPGSPVALGAGSLVLLGAAVLGVRRRSGEFATGLRSGTGPRDRRST